MQTTESTERAQGEHTEIQMFRRTERCFVIEFAERGTWAQPSDVPLLSLAAARASRPPVYRGASRDRDLRADREPGFASSYPRNRRTRATHALRSQTPTSTALVATLIAHRSSLIAERKLDRVSAASNAGAVPQGPQPSAHGAHADTPAGREDPAFSQHRWHQTRRLPWPVRRKVIEELVRLQCDELRESEQGRRRILVLEQDEEPVPNRKLPHQR